MYDLKKLIGHHAAVTPEYLSDNDVLIVVCDITLPHLTTGNFPYRIQKLLAELIQVTQEYNRPLKVEDVIGKLLVVLSLVRTSSRGKILINLGEPNYDLLPPEK